MLHCFFLCVGLKLSSDLFVEMHSVGRFIVTVMTKGNCKTVYIGLFSVATAEYMVNLYPLPRATYKALFLGTDN